MLLAYNSTRFLIYYAISIAPVLLISLVQLCGFIAKILNKNNVGRYLVARISNLETMESNTGQGRYTFIIVGAVFIIYAVVTGKVLFFSDFLSNNLGPDSGSYPKYAVSYLNKLEEKDVKVFNTTNLGGYLNGFTGDNIKYFIDDRTSYHGKSRYDY